MLGDQFLQIFQPAIREGHRVLFVGTIDPKTAVFRLHVDCKVPQWLLVLADDLSDTGDGEHVCWRRHDQPSTSSAFDAAFDRLRRRRPCGGGYSSSMATAPPDR